MSGEGSAEKYSIASALQVMQASLLALAFAERYGMAWSKLISVIVRPDKSLEIMLDADAFVNLHQQFSTENRSDLDFNPAISSIVISNPAQWLISVSGQKIFDKFPFYSEILNLANYDQPGMSVEKSLLKRCRLMARMWEDWAQDDGIPHLLSSLQAMFRQVAAKMAKPFVLDLPAVIENGLSVEYQCEIYADQLYGAKLLDVWNYYLLSDNIDNKKLEHFKLWLRDYPEDELFKKFGINKEKIPTVTYIHDQGARLAWILHISGLIVSNDRLPPPQDEPLEIIFVLGRHENKFCFFGGLKERGIINHSSFFAGQKVDGAGRMILIPQQNADGSKQWKLARVDNNSGHIKPDNEMSIKVLTALQAAGANLEEIKWRSKWGSPGLHDETAAVALHRLQRKFTVVEAKESSVKITSLFLRQLISLANRGNIHDLYHYYLANRHKINQYECVEVAEVLLAFLECTPEKNVSAGSMHDKLTDQVFKLLRMCGKYELSIMERVHKIKSRAAGIDHQVTQRLKLFHGSNDRNYISDVSDDNSPEFSG